MSHPALDKLPPIHPGEILKDDLQAMGMSARQFAQHIGVPPNAVTGILNGTRGITASMALRLGRAFAVDPRYWTNLQSYYETKLAAAELGSKLKAIKPLSRAGRAA